MNFDAFTEDIRKNRWNVFGAEVYKEGRLIHRYGDTDEKRHPIYSATKTITSLAVGMAAEEGKLDIHKSILAYLPTEITGKMTAEQRNKYEKISTRRLMTMSVSGYPFRPEGESWLESALNNTNIDEECTAFDYSNVSAYLAGVTAACAQGEDLYEYLERKLFAPLGIVKPPCVRCPDGFFYGASSMELTVNELSRIGLMMYNGGVYEGNRIVPEKYIKEATAVQQMNREGGYGYFVWKYRSGFSINGKWQQKCYVLPEEGMMVTYLSHIEEKTSALRESMEKNILEIGG